MEMTVIFVIFILTARLLNLIEDQHHLSSHVRCGDPCRGLVPSFFSRPGWGSFSRISAFLILTARLGNLVEDKRRLSSRVRCGDPC